ncbi:MAG: dihydroneopterin aldolase [Alphaproteobacteria bacterium]|nr:dihydroneopterin aldolase [Alphaproteobacteria bacterium]
MKSQPIQDSYACIYLRDMEVKVRVGLHPWERKPQRLRITVELYTDPAAYLKSPEKNFLDYDKIRKAVMEWPGRPHIDLIETFVKELLDLSFSFKTVDAARVAVSKPDIFPESQGPGVEVFMRKAEYNKVL